MRFLPPLFWALHHHPDLPESTTGAVNVVQSSQFSLFKYERYISRESLARNDHFYHEHTHTHQHSTLKAPKNIWDHKTRYWLEVVISDELEADVSALPPRISLPESRRSCRWSCSLAAAAILKQVSNMANTGSGSLASFLFLFVFPAVLHKGTTSH